MASSDGDESRRWRKKVKGRRTTDLLELLTFSCGFNIFKVDEGVLREVHDLPQIVEQPFITFKPFEQLDQGLGADLLVVPAEIENKTTPGIVR